MTRRPRPPVAGNSRSLLLSTAVCAATLLSLLAFPSGAEAVQDPGPDGRSPAADSARTLVEHAVALMGGDALSDVERVRLDMTTQWQRTSYRGVPWRDRPSLERHVDVRDYRIGGWRNTRQFGARDVVNVIRDSVGITDLGGGFQPQSVAYVDERDELFTYTPDRLVLLLRDAPDLRLAGDTLFGGERHVRVRATLHGDLPVTVAFHAGTGLPAWLGFRQGHPNDFGLVPFGDMWVEVRYSNWATFGDVSIPRQWDVVRAGAPYKRMTVRGADFDPDFAADSFAVSDDLRAAFLAARRPMHDRPVDSVTVVDPGLAVVHGFGFPAGALRVGGGWTLLEAGHATLMLERALAALEETGVDPDLQAAVVAAARPGNGGIVELVRRGVPVYTSPAAEPFLRVMLANAGEAWRGVTVVTAPTRLGTASDAPVLAPIDLPDVPGALLLWDPARRWLWSPDAVTPLDVRLVRERAVALGWEPSRVGTAREVWPAAPGG